MTSPTPPRLHKNRRHIQIQNISTTHSLAKHRPRNRNSYRDPSVLAISLHFAYKAELLDGQPPALRSFFDEPAVKSFFEVYHVANDQAFEEWTATCNVQVAKEPVGELLHVGDEDSEGPLTVFVFADVVGVV
jgi:hypothetical protein